MVLTVHACHGALWVRVKGEAHIRGLLTEYKQWNMNVKLGLKLVCKIADECETGIKVSL